MRAQPAGPLPARHVPAPGGRSVERGTSSSSSSSGWLMLGRWPAPSAWWWGCKRVQVTSRAGRAKCHMFLLLEAGWQGRHCCWVVLGVGSHASTLRCRRGGGSLQLRALCLLLHHIFPLAGLLSASPQMRPCPQCWWTATPPSDAPSWTSCSGGCRAVLRCASWCCNVLGCDAMCCDLLGCAGLSCAALGCDVPRPLLDEMVGGPA